MRLFALIALSASLIACNNDFTVGDEAEVVGEAYCDLFLHCNQHLTVTKEVCVDIYVTGVCNNHNCSEPAQFPSECIQALESHTCTPGNAPECEGVLK